MAIISVDPDYARRKRDMRSGIIALPKCLSFVAHKVTWGLDKFAYRLSTSVVDLGELSKVKRCGEGLLGKTECVRAEDFTVQAEILINFDDLRSTVVG